MSQIEANDGKIKIIFVQKRSSAKAMIDGDLFHSSKQRLHVWVGSNHGASIIKLEPLD
jgi:hypothetical protein